MSGLYETVRGAVRLEIFGALPESVLNAAALEGMELWDLECVNDNTLRLSLYETELEAFRALTEKCMCSLELMTSKGGSRSRQAVRRRLSLLIFAAVTAALLLISSLFIWEIELRGNEKLSRGQVLRALEDCGVESGAYWPALSSDLVRSKMIALLPDIGWMAVNVNGSRAVVLITERQAKPEIYSQAGAADIVAGRTGLIRRISVLNGKAEVSPGQAVTEGELLVSGTMDSLCGGSRFVRAKATVMADTWYELCSVSPVRELQKEEGIFSRSRFAVVLGKRRINLFLGTGKAIDGCDKIIHEYTLGIEGLFALPVKLLREEYRGYTLSERSAARTQDMETALEQALLERVEGQVLERSFTESRCGDLYVLTLRAHCLEDIALTLDMAE